MKRHHPPHLFYDKTYYFLSARTYQSEPVFKDNRKKRILLSRLKAVFQRYNYRLFAWTILDNHYHLEFFSHKGKILPRIMNYLHGRVSYEINKLDNKKGRKIFQNYWDRCLRDEKEIWTRFNYIHHNPVKHGYVNKTEDYPFSSYKGYMLKYSKEWLDSIFELYPIIDFTSDNIS